MQSRGNTLARHTRALSAVHPNVAIGLFGQEMGAPKDSANHVGGGGHWGAMEVRGVGGIALTMTRAASFTQPRLSMMW